MMSHYDFLESAEKWTCLIKFGNYLNTGIFGVAIKIIFCALKIDF